jgi:hypothetical protein
MHKPILWKLTAAIGHVSAAENAEFQHLLGRHFRQKSRIKAHADRLGKVVDVILLHEIIDDNFAVLHHVPPPRPSCLDVMSECYVCHGSHASARSKLKMIPDCADFLDGPFEYDNEYAYECECYGSHASAKSKLKMIPDCADFLDGPFEYDNEYAYEYGTHATNPCAPIVLSDL